MPEIKMGIDLTQTVNKQKFAKALFGITQVMEGTQFYALFAMIVMPLDTSVELSCRLPS